jgi:hypothetical protein
MKGKSLRSIVTEFLEPRLRSWLYHGYDTNPIVDRSRGPIWLRCLKAGLDKTIGQQMRVVIQQLNCMPLEWEDIPEKERLTHAPGENPPFHDLETSRWDIPEMNPGPSARQASDMLDESEFVIDEEITDTQRTFYDTLSMEERSLVFPAWCEEELELIGSSVFCTKKKLFDQSRRIYTKGTKGVVDPSGSKHDRARVVMDEWRTTDIDLQTKYMEAMGLDERKADAILLDPVKYFQEGGKQLVYAQCVSWRRILESGQTNILAYADSVTNGYLHQCAERRDPDLLIHALPFRKDFIDIRWGLCHGLRQSMPAFRKKSLEEMMPLGKFVFTPSIYLARQRGLFNHATGQGSVEDMMLEDGEHRRVVLPPMIGEVIGDCPEDEKAAMLWKLCGQWSRVFQRKVPKSGRFGTYWMQRWQEERDPEGLYMPHPDGGQVLVPYLKRDRHETVCYYADWMEDGRKVPDSATIYAPRFDDDGTSAASARAQIDDGFNISRAVVNAKGAVKVTIHDNCGFFLADNDIVQRAFTKGFNETHEIDYMRTGKPQILIPEHEWMLNWG